MKIYENYLQLKDKKISSLELTQDALKKAKDGKHNAFITVTEDLALAQAKQADKEIGSRGIRSYIQGIPYTLKDLFVTEGVRTTAGSKMLYNYIPPYDGYVSQNLKNAGAVLIGKVGCDEFGMGSCNANTPFGLVTNPNNPRHVAGGSSGGSAASVAEGSSLFSIGTDTGGSIRLPANFCGLTGLKPTYGRISRYGQIAYASSLDQASPIAGSALDIACLIKEITSKDPKDATHAPLPALDHVEKLLSLHKDFFKGKKVSYCEDHLKGCDDEVKKALDDALSLMKKEGATCLPVQMPHLKYAVSTYYIIATCEASSNLARYDGIHFGHRAKGSESLEDTYVLSRTEGFNSEVKKRILLGAFSLSSGYYDAYYRSALKVRRLIRQDFDQAFSQSDFFFSPVCVESAFKIGADITDSFKMYLNDIFTIPANLAGLPALSLPFGKSGGMPTGFQLVAPAFKDSFLLEAGHAFQRIIKE